MYKGNKVVVGMPAYNEAEAIESVVNNFTSEEHVDEVIVIDNNSEDNTRELAKKAGAEVVEEPRQGYGYACQRALKEASRRGDLAVLVESDDTFFSRDIEKLLAYSEDFDFVVGSRTSRNMIWEEADMSSFLRWGNWFLAKFLELLHNTSSLTDIGCTYRLIESNSYKEIQEKLKVGGSHFSPEMLIKVSDSEISMAEIPINYKSRKGNSKITNNNWNSFKLGIRMIILITKEKIR